MAYIRFRRISSSMNYCHFLSRVPKVFPKVNSVSGCHVPVSDMEHRIAIIH